MGENCKLYFYIKVEETVPCRSKRKPTTEDTFLPFLLVDYLALHSSWKL